MRTLIKNFVRILWMAPNGIADFVYMALENNDGLWCADCHFP